MTIPVGSIWLGTQAHHKWIVRVRKTLQQHTLVEVIGGPSGHLKTLKKFTIAQFRTSYSPRDRRGVALTGSGKPRASQ